MAEAALEHGAIVVISGSRQPKIDATIERLLKTYPDAKDRLSGYPCDLANEDTTKVEENIEALFKFATKDGKLDHIAKTSGNSLQLPKLSEFTAEKFYAMQKVRLLGSALVAKHSMEHINISSASSVTLTGGVNSYKPSPGWAIAAGTGSGVDGLTRGLAVDMKPVRVNCVAPGAILTELWDSTFATPEQLEKIKEQYSSKHLVGGLGAPEDTAEAYIYFMKDKFVDGQTIITEGGYLLGS